MNFLLNEKTRNSKNEKSAQSVQLKEIVVLSEKECTFRAVLC